MSRVALIGRVHVARDDQGRRAGSDRRLGETHKICQAMGPSLDEAVISDGESEGEPGGRSAINLRWVGIKCVGKPCKTGQTLCRSDELTQPVLEHHIAAVLLQPARKVSRVPEIRGAEEGRVWPRQGDSLRPDGVEGAEPVVGDAVETQYVVIDLVGWPSNEERSESTASPGVRCEHTVGEVEIEVIERRAERQSVGRSKSRTKSP
jgi:hypothetical protein